MATFNKIKSNTSIPVSGLGRKGITVVRINTQLTNIVGNDTWQVLGIPARTVIESVDVIGVTPNGAANVFHIGDGGTNNVFGENVSANLNPGVAAVGNNFARRKYYHNANVLTITPTSNLTQAIFDLVVHWTYLGDNQYDTVY